MYGVQLFKIGKLQLYLQYMKEALRSLEQAQEIIEVTHGKEHDLYSNVTLFVNECREEMRVSIERK